MKDYYFVVILFMLLPLLFYCAFRGGVRDMLKIRHIGKSRVNRMSQGFKNCIWYEEIHRQKNIGWIYTANKIFTLLWFFTFIIHLILGWSKIFAILICISCTIIYIMSSVLFFYGDIETNKLKYGKAIVFLRKNKVINRVYYDSIILDVLGAFFQVLIAFVQISILLELL